MWAACVHTQRGPHTFLILCKTAAAAEVGPSGTAGDASFAAPIACGRTASRPCLATGTVYSAVFTR